MSGMWKTGGLTPAARLSVCNYGLCKALRDRELSGSLPNLRFLSRGGAEFAEEEKETRTSAIPASLREIFRSDYFRRMVRTPHTPPAVLPGWAWNFTVMRSLPCVSFSGSGWTSS